MSETRDIPIRSEVAIDPDSNIRVMVGVPTQIDQDGIWNPPGTEMIIIPNIPHVFQVDKLTVRDKTHPQEQLSDVNVLIAHGVRVNNKWGFSEGGEVVETVSAYNQYAAAHGLKPIEFLVVCNQTESHPLGIRVGEFDAKENISYSVGENVHLTLGGKSKVDSGKTTMEVSVDSTFFGLDQLINHKRLQSQIKVL